VDRLGSLSYGERDSEEATMGVLSWILFGLVAGIIARLLTPGSGAQGCLVTIAIGIAGAAIGGWIGTQLGLGTVQGFDFRSLGLAVIGAILLLLVFRALRGPYPPYPPDGY
jgi:uncharacterized membrane protein YeaQ/YmgE (transglycosylase-associated protein family)